MGGSSFLLKKKFHPARMDNQKRVFIAEQESHAKRQRETDAAREVEKEKEQSYYEKLGEVEARDPRQSSLKFMYSAPASSSSSSSLSSRSQPGQTTNINAVQPPNLGKEDPAVVAFWEKVSQQRQQLKEKEKSTDTTRSTEQQASEFSASSAASAVDLPVQSKSDGKPPVKPLNPALRNAPVEGLYVKGMSNAKHKPFNDLIRNVQCSLCGAWGHRFGDRECALREHNPHDKARMLREDPMTYMQNQSLAQQPLVSAALPEQKQRMVLNEAATSKLHRPPHEISDQAAGDDDESDPEAEYLATLSAREKKLLLRKLRQLQGEHVDAVSGTDSSSSDDSSRSSTDSSSEIKKSSKRRRKHKDKDKHKRKKRSKKHSH